MLEQEDGLPADVRFLPEPLVGGSQGAIEGIVLGACAALLVALLASLGSEELATLAASLVAGGGALALGSLLWRRVVGSGWERSFLLASGVAAALAAVAPAAILVAVSDDATAAREAGAILGTGVGAGLAIGAIQRLAAAPFDRVPRRHLFARLFLLFAYWAALAGSAKVVAEASGDFRGNVYVLALVTLALLPLVALAGGIARGTVERRSRRGKPAASNARAVGNAAASAEAAREELELAALATNVETRGRLLASALEHARAAHGHAAARESYEPSLSAERRRHLELAFLLGNRAEIDALERAGDLEPFLRAEAARLRGAPDRALELANAALAAPEATAADRANALAVLAHAEVDLGRVEDARERLDPLRRAQAFHAPFVGRFRADAIEERILERETSARAPGVAVRER